MKSQKITINTIAKLAGVSKASVSRVLNDYPHISADIRQKVMAVVNETGYQRNQVARMLASNRSNMIGLVIPSGAKFVFSDPYFPKLTEGISQAANHHQLTLSLFLFNSKDEGIFAVKNIIANGLFDGVIITGDRTDDAILPLLMENDMPFVLIGRAEDDEIANSIDVDNFAGGKLATEHLIQDGYRRIAIIGCEHNLAAVDRFEGYREALAENGIEYDPELVANGDFSMESGATAMTQLLPYKPDALFITSDTMALGALRILREQNLNVPKDIAIVGFDDLSPAVQADPPLTTIQQPVNQQGWLAVETLMSLIDKPEQTPQHVELPVKLIIRASTNTRGLL